MKLAISKGATWEIKILDTGSFAGLHSSLAIDGSDYVYISYYENQNLMCVSNATGDWATTTLEDHATDDVGKYSSLVIDKNTGIMAVSYYDATNKDLKLVYYFPASGWLAPKIIDWDGDLGNYSSIAIDSDGKLHISYHATTNFDLKYATNATGSWVATIADTTNLFYSSIAIDDKGKAHVISKDYNYLTHSTTNITDVWQSAVIDSRNVLDYKNVNSIGVDSEGYVHACHYDYNTGNIVYLTNKSGSWTSEVIGKTYKKNKEAFPSLAVDRFDFIHISYPDASPSLIHVTNTSGNWVSEIVGDPSPSEGYYSSIAVDRYNNIHISYHGDGNGSLKYATNSSGNWVTQEIDTTALSGMFDIDGTSLAVDSTGKIHIAYLADSDPTSGPYQKKYITNATGDWVATAIEPSVGAMDISLALDSRGKAHIAYEDTGIGKVKHATNSSGNWVTEIADNDNGVAGNGIFIAVDDADNIHISHQEYNNGNVVYSSKINGIWDWEVIDTPTYDGYQPALAIAGGYVHIIYNDGDLINAYYAKKVDPYYAPPSFPWNMLLPAIINNAQ